jgi:hypothetical protein
MDKRVVGTLLGIAGMLLWFMPWMAFSMGEMDFHRTGSHIGGIAYVLLMSSLASAILSWVPSLCHGSSWRRCRRCSAGSSG